MSHIHITRHDDILHVEIARPEKKNALTGAMYDAMREALAEADAGELGAVLLSGQGGIFTAGNDIADFLAARGTIESNPASTFILALAQCRTPLIAAVEGLAIGIGTTMLLHCDLVYAAPDAMFKMPFVDLGLVPEAGASMLVPARVGQAKAAEWLMLGETFSAEEALAAGLVNSILPAESLKNHASGVAKRLAAKPRRALRQTRALMRSHHDELLQHMHKELELVGAALHSTEARQAFMAFMARKG